jgi:hypothetical protein
MNPGPGTHVELWQQAALGPLVVDQCMHDFSAHASVPDWGGGWTGVYSMNAFTPGGVISNSIFWGIEEVNAARPGRITCIVAYGGLSPTTANNLTLTNNVLEAGAFGYTKDQNGSTHRPGDGGGNRSRRNLAITAADFS